MEVLRVLLRAGAEKDAATLRGRWTPLHVACRYTSVECVLELLRWGADLGPTARPPVAPPASEGGGACLCSRRNEESFVCDAHGGAVAASDGQEEEEREEEEGDDEGNGYGKTPAEVIGLKHLATAAATGPAGNGGSGPSADPSLDEEGEQMVVFGDDDGEKSPPDKHSKHPAICSAPSSNTGLGAGSVCSAAPPPFPVLRLSWKVLLKATYRTATQAPLGCVVVVGCRELFSKRRARANHDGPQIHAVFRNANSGFCPWVRWYNGGLRCILTPLRLKGAS